MEIRPILSALSRNKVGAFLIALQVAITLAVISNSVYIIEGRNDIISRPTGMDLDNTFVLTVTSIQAIDDSSRAVNMNQLSGDFETQEPAGVSEIRYLVKNEIDTIRATPGVEAATIMRQYPMSGNNWCSGFQADLDNELAEEARYCNLWSDEQGFNVLDLKMVEGRYFNEDEIKYTWRESGNAAKQVVISKAVAEQLFPDGNAVGRIVYEGDDPDEDSREIVGVYEALVSGSVYGERAYQTAIKPEIHLSNRQNYVIRVEPGQLQTVMDAVRAQILKNPNRMVSSLENMQTYKKNSYSPDIAMIKILSVVIGLLAAITVLGVIGLAWFNVNKRRKQIGTRRALGAQRWDIVRYFLVENWLTTTMGLIVGVFLALLLNYQLDDAFQTGKMNFSYIAIGALLLWVIGLVAVFIPARKAAGISPAIATRTA